MPDSDNAFVRAIDAFSVATGRAISWMTLAMVLATCVVVVLRYVFDTGVLWLQESVTWMHAVVFMLGAAYTLQRDEHVRVDVFYRDMSVRRKAIVDLDGVVLFVIPLCGFLLVSSIDYVAASWSVREVSRDAGGLPYPFIPLLKSALLLMPVALCLQAVSMGLRAALRIRAS